GSLSAGERLLVCGSSVPATGEPLLGSIENGPDAVRLLVESITVDIVGYGDVPYREGEPAPDVPAGLSLSRKPDGFDSDDNASDFVPAGPTPGLPNFFDRDLELAPGEAPLPCCGEPFAMGFRLVNRGLERFTGGVVISASAGAGSGEIAVDVDLAPSESKETAVELPYAPQESFVLRARIESAADENVRNDTASAPIGPSPGDLVVSEIMYRPMSGGSEWLEVASRAAVEISLARWRLSDATGTRRLVSEGGLSIEPGGHIVLAQDSALFVRDHPLCPARVAEPSGGWPWLNDGEEGDEVALYDPAGRVVERVRYTDLVGEERGRSIERFSTDVCSSFPGGLWHRSSSPAGSTPGVPNSTSLPAIPSPGTVEAAPNPFCPVRDGTVRIWGMTAAGETGLLVRIFDIDGVEVERLFGEEEGARVFGCEWDGRAAGGTESPTGLYICVVEFITRGGGVCRREKRCIALYR
ncbi:MAG TPA: lamin tail domain-containing protein, partial [Candidatus Eisenbacteria bacterium]|nr:lamin tail domain-containing protein [Candidatus Eisenbacteria bacterium]